mmetsp:Transcript_15557/g.33795  ORF Transcript_15557/g.33795 Transcript_15557/m.33795 type:complete len:438 (+) Transcript_15557:838-2151(+)
MSCVLRVASAHHDDLHSASHPIAFIIQEPAKDARDEVNALLVAETTTEAQQASVGVLVQTQLLLESLLAGSTSLQEVSRAVVLGDVGVSHRAPLVGDAIEDAGYAESGGLLLQHGVHAEAALRRLDLLGVVGGDREHPIAGLHGALQKVQAVSLHVKVLTLKVDDGLLRQTQVSIQGEARQPVLALETEVVDHEDGAGVEVGAVLSVLVSEVDRQEADLPVVGEEDAVLPVGGSVQVQDQGRLRCRQGQQGEAEEVVLVLLASVGIAIEPCWPSVAVMVDEDVVAATLRTVVLALVEILHLAFLPIEPDLGGADIGHVVVLTIARGHRHGAVAAHRELVGVGADDHAEAAGLGPRVDLGGDDHHRSAQVPGTITGGAVLLLGLHAALTEVRSVLQVEAIEGGETGNSVHARKTASVREVVRQIVEGLFRSGIGFIAD